jgi:hypothetical protein
MALGKNVRTKDGKVEIELNEWLQPIQNDGPALEAECIRLEPLNSCVRGEQLSLELSNSEKWRRRRDSNPRPLA